MTRRRRFRFRGRDIQGILLFDKPINLSSNAALQKVKHLFCARKAGHTGSLDPLATGLLPICFGQATRVCSFLLDASKSYEVVGQLGMTTSTGDLEGEQKQSFPLPTLTTEQAKVLLESKFTGPILQTPPMHSALRHQGQRLYKLARQGVEVKRTPREVTIYGLKLRLLTKDRMHLAIHCSKGVYIRTLIEDIGQALGSGAYVSSLRRVAVAPFDAPKMVTLEHLIEQSDGGMQALDALLLPTDAALTGFPSVYLSDHAAYYLNQGQAVQVAKTPGSGWVRLYNDQGQFIGVGAIQDDGKVAPKKLML